MQLVVRGRWVWGVGEGKALFGLDLVEQMFDL
jgi:hypothetical protein